MTPAERYKEWLLRRARELRAADEPPRSPRDVERRAERIRAHIRKVSGDAWLGAEARRRPPAVEILGNKDCPGYHLERLLLETRPGVWATCNTYRPAGLTGKLPAVLCVHGHWAGARRDPTVQARCVGLARLGFFVLTLDAWGAGERGSVAGTNEYHGGMLGAGLWPVNTPLNGLQLWDNVRALDYLQSRPEVDSQRLGCTGASGGGNQTTLLSGFDPRIRCAVPVCSVGTFASYLNAACCVDEVLAGALTVAEEGDLLGCVAPNALMVITASRDSYHFGPIAAREALDRTEGYFAAAGFPEKVRHVVFESGHDYSRPMREAMYGWMSRWLKGLGDGAPIPEPPGDVETLESLRCFEPTARPARVVTTLDWTKRRAEELARKAEADDSGHGERRKRLREILAMPADDELPELPVAAGGAGSALVLLLHPLGSKAAAEAGLAARLAAANLRWEAMDLPGCGTLALANQGLGRGIDDHNLVEWCLWVGRPLLGQWVKAVLRRVATASEPVAVVGWREAGVAALLAGGLQPRLRLSASVEGLASFRGDGPPHGTRMVQLHPGVLTVGDVPHLAELAAAGGREHPRAVVARPLRLNGTPASESELAELYGGARKRGGPRLVADPGLTDDALASHLQRALVAGGS